MNEVILIDARGMRCPWPALRVARAMRSSSDVLVLSDDPIAPGELAALALESHWICRPAEDDRAPAFRITRPQRP